MIFIIDVCAETAFLCEGSSPLKCIPRRLICDGKSDCSDGLDENDSYCDACLTDDNVTVSTQCSDGKCVKRDYMCDTIPDCTSNEDEHGCG